MKLHDLHGQKFELKILGYEFPEIVDDEWDSNWLRIHMAVNSNAGKWKTVNSCLRTVNIKEISQWFTAIPQNKAKRVIDFTEPNLKFENVSNDKNFIIRIYFELESRPSWKPTKGVGSDDFFVDFTLDKNQLIQASKDLQEELKQFPIRAL